MRECALSAYPFPTRPDRRVGLILSVIKGADNSNRAATGTPSADPYVLTPPYSDVSLDF